ncbi:MAG: sigma factor-like helix-turn-helix DNA-binding protein [Candidatus Eisenbacteria bacterium]|nr:sigma factor-like helix-turn-helix DNA-binding protein [Candidatus Eisenbacteria bacterium]
MKSGSTVEERPRKTREKDLESGERVTSNSRLVESLLLVLSEDERMVLSLRYLERMSFRDIAAVLDIPLARVVGLHSNGLSFIKSRLAQSFEWPKCRLKRA